MKTLVVLFSFLMMMALPYAGTAQDTEKDKQTLRGRVVNLNNQPVEDVLVKIANSGIGAYTDKDGNYEISDLPTIRRLTVLFIFEDDTLASENIELNIAREGVLDMKLPYYEVDPGASFGRFNPIPNQIVPSNPEISNEARKLDIKGAEQAIAAADDLGRMVMRLPGVQAISDNQADIIIRGNSPAGLMWRLEGIDIPNPNHFARKGQTGGGITMFSAQVLGDAYFFTGRMPAGYGNSFAGAFDLSFREGNLKEQEHRIRVGAIGIDLATEGPIKKGHSSYLINYRYSFLGILSALNVNGLNEPNTSNTFQDLSFNLYLPTKGNKSVWTIFGVGGLSTETWDVDSGRFWVNRFFRQERDFTTNAGVLGFTFSRPSVEKSSLFKISAAIMGNMVRDNDFEVNVAGISPGGWPVPNFNSLPRDTLELEQYNNSRVSTHMFYRKYFGQNPVKSTFKTGLIASHMGFSFNHDDILPFETQLVDLVNGDGSTQLIEPYANLMLPFFSGIGDEKRQVFKIVAGVHGMFLTLNGTWALDPRLSMTYNVDNSTELTVGYGMHSRMVTLGSYFTRNDQGVEVNKDLDLIRSHQFSGTFRKLFPNIGQLQVDGYYQYLFNVPVTSAPSFYWLLNEREGYATQALVSDGTGRNYGVDVSFQRPLIGKLFWTVSGSVYRSEFTGSNGIPNNTRFGRMDFNYYAVNTIGGDFAINEKVALQVGVNIVAGSGTNYTGVDTAATLAAGQLVFVDEPVFNISNGPYFRIDTRTAVRFGRWLISLDIQNVLNKVHDREPWFRFGEIDMRRQTGFTPLFSIRADF